MAGIFCLERRFKMESRKYYETEMESTLLEFVKRVSREGATDAEVEALPAGAGLLARITNLVD